MFLCEILNIQSQPGEKCFRLVIQTRPKSYYGWRENSETEEFEWVEIGKGYEEVKSVNASEEGVKRWQSWSEDQKQAFIKSLQQPSKKEDNNRRLVKR